MPILQQVKVDLLIFFFFNMAVINFSLGYHTFSSLPLNDTVNNLHYLCWLLLFVHDQSFMLPYVVLFCL